MDQDLQQAIDTIIRINGEIEIEEYLRVCESIVARREELAHHVYIIVPDGDDQTDPRWVSIREASVGWGDNGCQRTILPPTARNEYVAPDVEELVTFRLEDEVPIHLKSRHAPLEMAFFSPIVIFDEDKEANVFALEVAPFAPSMSGEPTFVCMLMSELRQHLATCTGSFSMHTPEGVPAFRFVSVNEDLTEVTVSLDRDVDAIRSDEIDTASQDRN